jgi:HK97 family phage major capsid protein
MKKMKPSIKKFESEDSINESKDLNNKLHIKEERIMNDESIIPSENEGTDNQPESSDRVSGKEKLFRSVDMSRSDFIDEDNRTVRIALTSESPVKRSFGWEILDHSQESIDTDFIGQGRAPLLLDHDMARQIGIIEDYILDESSKRTLAQVRFGRSDLASEIWQDVKDGIRNNVSVGYSITNMEKDRDAKEPTYRVAWQPLEASIVSIPADQSVNVGVARSDPSELNPTTKVESTPVEETEAVEEINTQNIKVKTMSEEIKNDVEIDIEKIKTSAVTETRANVAKENDEILELGSRHSQSDLARAAIREGVSIEDFRGQLLNALPTDQPLDTKEIGLTDKESRTFSILKAVNAMANPSDRRAQEAARFEFECSDAAKEKYGRNSQGLTLPAELMNNWQARDINTSDDSSGVGTRFLPSSFINALRNASGVIAAGATVLPDLEDNVSIPKQSGVSTAAWISAEGGAAAESELTLATVSLTPKTASMYTEITNQMLQQSTLGMENIIRNDLAAGIANLIDTGALAGSGSSGQPTGIDNQTGVNTQTFATASTPTFAEIVAMEGSVLGDNVMLSNPSYLTTSAVAANMKSTSKDTGSGTFILDNGQANGHPVYVSNAVASGVAYFGNWSDLLIGMFGSIDILVDPYTASANSITRLRATQFVDIAVRHAQSFTKGTA